MLRGCSRPAPCQRRTRHQEEEEGSSSGKMSGQQFLSKTIVVPTPGSSGLAANGSASDLSRPSSAGASSSAAGMGNARRERRNRPASASSGLAMAEERRKRKGFGALRKVRRFFSRSDDMRETRVGEVADHAFNCGSVIKYTPGPENLHAPRHHAHSHSEPTPMATSDLRGQSRPTASPVPSAAAIGNNSASSGAHDYATASHAGHYPQATRTAAEATRYVSTEEQPVSGGSGHGAVQQTSPTIFSRRRAELSEKKTESPQGEELGDRPVHLTVKLINRLKDQNEDPTVNAREVVISKGKNGFDLSLAGSNPVVVMRIDPNGPADRAGILVGDMIVAVSDIDVRRSTQAHVYKMMVHASKASKQSLDVMNEAEWNAIKSVQERLDSDQPTDVPVLPPTTHGSGQTTEMGVTVVTRIHDEADQLAIGKQDRHLRRFSLDLTSDTELSDHGCGTPDSAMSRHDASPSPEPSPKKERDSSSDQTDGQDSNMSTGIDVPTSAIDGATTEGAGEGFGVLIRQQSKKMLHKRLSTALLHESSTLPVAVETEEDERIVEMVNARHSMLLTEAVEMCRRERLDEKTPDAHLSDAEEENPTVSTGDTPMSGLSTPDSGDGLESKSDPNSPATRRRVKVRRTQSSKGNGVIVKQKSGRVLVAPRPRPTILPGDVAARLVERDQPTTSPHVDSGYISLHQDQLDAQDLEEALMAASLRGTAVVSEGSNVVHNGNASSHVAGQSGVSHTAISAVAVAATDKRGLPASTQDDIGAPSSRQLAASSFQSEAGKPSVRRAKSMMVSSSRGSGKTSGVTPVTSPSEAVPGWKLELQKQRQAKEGTLISQPQAPVSPSNSNPQTQGAVGSRSLKRMNSANVVAAAAAKKESVVAREQRSISTGEAPPWVALAKDKSRRASIHEDTVPGVPTSTQSNPGSATTSPIKVAAPLSSRSTSSSSIHSQAAGKQLARPKSVSASTLPRLREGVVSKEAVKEPPKQHRSIVLGMQEICIVCHKAVYHSERFSAEGLVFHITCTRCYKCQRKLHVDKLIIVQKQMYCKQHSMEVSMKLAPDLASGAPMPNMSARGGALAMHG